MLGCSAVPSHLGWVPQGANPNIKSHETFFLQTDAHLLPLSPRKKNVQNDYPTLSSLSQVAYSVEEGLDIAVSGDFDLVVVDLHMPTFSGIEFCRAVRGVDLESGGGAPIAGSTIAGAASVSAADRPRLLLHTTAAGSVKSDELEVGGASERTFQYFAVDTVRGVINRLVRYVLICREAPVTYREDVTP